MNKAALGSLGAVAVLACAAPACAAPAFAAAPTGECPAEGDLVAYCGLPNPEDIEVLPGGKGLIVSDMGIRRGGAGLESRPGALKWLDPKTRRVTALYPAPTAPAGRGDWGDPACPGEIGAALNAHGIHLSRRAEGRWQLLVVNHNTRESVEFFELTDHAGQWGLRWRGCAVPPAGSRLNDVVAVPGGGFLVTHMGARDADPTRGENPGWLWRWIPGRGFSEQPGSRIPRPNGVQIDATGKFAYVMSGANGGEVWKLDLARARILGKAAMSKPDNASWSRDGQLLVTGITREGNSAPCFQSPQAPCPAPFDVFAIDPATMVPVRIFAHSDSPVGGGTVAVQYGDDLMVGSFAGDRILAVRGQFKAAEPAAR